MSGDNEEQEAVDDASDKGEVAPESYKQAVLDPRWRESMMTEVRPLVGHECVMSGAGVCAVSLRYLRVHLIGVHIDVCFRRISIIPRHGTG